METTTLTKYITGRYRSARVFRCFDCEFDVLENESTIQDHCRETGHGKFHYRTTPVDTPLSVKITVGYLCWNTREASTEGVLELLRERSRLKRLGVELEVFVLDNGSQDGTANSILEATKEDPPDVFVSLPENCGSSIARNYFIDLGLRQKSDHLLLLDGDIEIVPMSIYEMARYLASDPLVGCIGAYSSGHSDRRDRVDTVSPVIANSRVKSNVMCAWTQYGLFRMEMFRQGVRFEEGGPFGVPGWGMEDDDLYFQMTSFGWDCRYFTGMTYLHRALHSSWASIGDTKSTFLARKEYFLEKWRRLGMDPAILNLERSQQFPGDSDER